jgi:translation initiation factor 1
MSESRLVYSTGTGRICPQCRKPAAECACRKKRTGKAPAVPPDGTIRIRRETKGRKGKTVTVAAGFDPEADPLDLVAKRLKRLCGSGGSVKNGDVIIQGDHRDKIRTHLEGLEHSVRFSGG